MRRGGHIADVSEEYAKLRRDRKKEKSKQRAREKRKEKAEREKQARDPKHRPDYNRKHIPGEIAGAKQGTPMTFEQANKGRVNPSIREGGLYGYSTNCQTCVVVFEARLRGFDVEALPNNRNGYIRDLSYDTTLAWIDPQTGTKPMQISKPHGVTKERFLKGHVIEGRRYTLQFTHGRGRNGHIVCIERIGGDLRIYDPQNGRTYTKGEIRSYLSEKSDLRLTRVDNCAINPHYADFIMRKA